LPEGWYHDREPIAAKPCRSGGLTDRALQPARQFLENLIAGVATESVVDSLEALQVDDHDGELPPFGARRVQPLGQAVEEQLAVGEARQGVVVGNVGELFLLVDVVEARRRCRPRDP